MEVNNMIKASIAIVVLAVVIVMGIAVIQNLSLEVRDSSSASSVVVVTTLGAVNTSNTILTTYPYAKTITTCVNGSGEGIATGNYTFVAGSIPNAGAATVTLLDGGASFVGSNMNCTITYEASTTEQAAADNFVLGLGIFGTFISIIALAVVAIIVIGIFRSSKKGEL